METIWDRLGSRSTRLDQAGPGKTRLEPDWTTLDQAGPNWTRLDRDRPGWDQAESGLDQAGTMLDQTWTDLDRLGQGWTKLIQVVHSAGDNGHVGFDVLQDEERREIRLSHAPGSSVSHRQM